MGASINLFRIDSISKPFIRPFPLHLYQTAIPYCVLKLTRAQPAADVLDEQQPGEEGAAAAPEGSGGSQGFEAEQDDACLLPAANASAPQAPAMVVDWEFHIVYSEVFRVPSLWLAAAWADGRPLTEAELARALPTPPDTAFALDHVPEGANGKSGEQQQQQGRGRHVVERWTMLSNDEHPVLGRPFCCLHPCGTAKRMRHLLPPAPRPDGHDRQQGQNGDGAAGLIYLIKWLGLVAPVVGLSYPAAAAAAASFGPRVLEELADRGTG